jgi:hypothetical protein
LLVAVLAGLLARIAASSNAAHAAAGGPQAPKPCQTGQCGITSPLVLTPVSTYTSVHANYQNNTDFYCGLYMDGVGSTAASNGAPYPEIAVGYYHWYNAGTPPFPCWEFLDESYRGSVSFDWSQMTSFAAAHGVASAILRYTIMQGEMAAQCVGSMSANADDISKYSPFPSVLPGGLAVAAAPVKDGWGFTYKVDLSNSFIPLNGSNLNPNMHIVFIGQDEQWTHEDNNHCWAILGNFTLTLTPAH